MTCEACRGSFKARSKRGYDACPLCAAIAEQQYQDFKYEQKLKKLREAA